MLSIARNSGAEGVQLVDLVKALPAHSRAELEKAVGHLRQTRAVELRDAGARTAYLVALA